MLEPIIEYVLPNDVNLEEEKELDYSKLKAETLRDLAENGFS